GHRCEDSQPHHRVSAEERPFQEDRRADERQRGWREELPQTQGSDQRRSLEDRTRRRTTTVTVGHKARSAAAPTEPYTGAAYLVQGGTAGYSFLELIFALGLIVTVVATATPQLMLTVDDARAAGAARFVAAKLRETRMNAIARSTDVGLEFVSTPSGYTYAAYIDGNRNGVRTAEI